MDSYVDFTEGDSVIVKMHKNYSGYDDIVVNNKAKNYRLCLHDISETIFMKCLSVEQGMINVV